MSVQPPAVDEEVMDDVCPICHVSITDTRENGMPTIIPCGHIFHTRCIEEVARHTSVCPHCRKHFIIPGVEPAPNKENVPPSFGCKEKPTIDTCADNEVDVITL
jgi:hypothetical protein